MPDILDTPAEEEQSALEGPSAISASTSVLTTNELHGSDKLSTGVGDTEDDVPLVHIADMIDIEEINETPTALRPESTEEILISVQIEVNEIQDTGEMETIPETALDVEIVNGTFIPNPVHKIQENAGMERAVKTENQTIMFQDRMTSVKIDKGIHGDDPVDNAINALDKTIVVEKEGTEMANSPREIQIEAANVTESTAPDPFAPIDDLINPEEGSVAAENTIDTTTVSVTNLHGNGEAEDIDGPGGLIGVGSSVESSGFTITEIADSTVVVEVFQAEQQQALWGFSDPLITPPEEEILEAIGDLRTTLDDDIVDREELPQSTEGLVLEVTTADDAEDDLQTYVDTLAGSSETIGLQNSQAPLEGSVFDDVEQPEANTKDTVMEVVPSAETGGDAEPLDLQDAQSLLPTATEMEMGDAVGVSVSPLISTLVSSPKRMQLTDVGVEIAVHNATQGQKDSIPGISVTEKEDDRSMPSEASSEARDSELVVDGDRVPTFESGPVSISMTSYDADKFSSIDDSAVDIVVEQETGAEDHSNAAEGGATNVLVASSTNGLGLDLEAALDSSAALMSETKPMVSAEAACVGPTVELEIYAQSNDIGIESALDVSTDILNGLPVGEALDRNEKKRGREEEVAVAEDEDDKENTKTAKISRDEISGGDDGTKIDAKIGEVVQVDKKRSRDDLESGAAEPDSCIQTKALKTGIIDDVAGLPSRKADTEQEADDAQECDDTEDKEEDVHVRIVNGAGLDSTAPRYKKRKIALMLGYSGAGYQGMQKNPGAITIEGELEEALFRAGAIAESNYGQPQKLDWRRAARTDKGVSAVGQVVSGCFFIDPPGFIERVNSHLPKQIRVYGYKRATAGFNAKKLCDRRKYEYVLPVYAFDPSVHLDRESAQALAAAEKVQSVSETEIKTTITNISGPAGEVDAHVTIDSEVKEDVNSVENGAVSCADPSLKVVEPLVETIVSPTTEATDNVSPNIEVKEDRKIFSNRMSASTEEATVVTEVTTVVTEVTQENVAAGVRVQTQEVLVETKEVTLTESVINLSPEEREALDQKASTASESVINLSPEERESLDQKASTASVEVLAETKEVLTEQNEATETLLNLSIEEKKEALDEKVKKSTYKFGEAEFNRLNRILAGFKGHHNFHNFTVRTKATDPSANRYIISFGVENTFTMDGIEFVRCSVVGHSFMLHQIRKMVGLAVAIMRGKAPESMLATALRRDTRINVPMAPELGLFLEECYYTAYNRRFHATHEEMSLNSYAAEVDEFKKEFIYPHIVSTEARDSTFAMWLHSLNDRHYPDFVTAREAEKLIKSQGS